MLATIVQIMGEDKAFDYLKALHKNVNQYTKSGAAPARAGGQPGETTGRHHVPARRTSCMVVEGAPVKVVAPCEGTGYEIGSMSIIKGAQEPGERQEVVRLGADAGGAGDRRAGEGRTRCRRTRRRRSRRRRPSSPTSSSSTYDFAKYGSSAERRRLLAKWDAEVKNLPK